MVLQKDGDQSDDHVRNEELHTQSKRGDEYPTCNKKEERVGTAF